MIVQAVVMVIIVVVLMLMILIVMIVVMIISFLFLQKLIKQEVSKIHTKHKCWIERRLLKLPCIYDHVVSSGH